MAAGHARNWLLNLVLFCVLFFAFGPNDYCKAGINSGECIEKSVQPWISCDVFSRNNMLTKSRAGYTKRSVPFCSNFSATFNVEYLRMCWDINLILDLNRQEHVQNVAELLLDIIERQMCDSCSIWTHIECDGVQSKQ